MEIKYLSHSSFLIKTKEAKVVTDPFDPKFVGLKFPRQEADVVTISHSHQDHSFTELIDGEPLILTWPGQFEKKGVRIWGSPLGNNVLYKIESEGISILHCGDLGAIPTENQLDEIGDVHILMVPVGGKNSITVDEAVLLAKKVEPYIVIPMHYAVPGISIDGLAPVSEFLTKMGITTPEEPLEKLVVKKEEFDVDQAMRVVVLK
jgi:L-ascorbate metabolism protein UlaG (beta-lactamase superfamily)